MQITDDQVENLIKGCPELKKLSGVILEKTVWSYLSSTKITPDSFFNSGQPFI